MKKKTTLCAVLLSSLFLDGRGPSSHAASPAPLALKIASARPNSDVQLKSIEWWASEVEKRTNGEVEFSFFWSGSLTKAGEELEAVRSGPLQFSPVAVGDYPSKLPLSNLSYAFPSAPMRKCGENRRRAV